MHWIRILVAAATLYDPALATGADASTPAPLGTGQMPQVFDFSAIVQADGRPIAGAQVDWCGRDGPQQTDATGSVFRYGSVRMTTPIPNAREGFSMMVRAAGFATEYSQGTIGPGTTTQVIDLERESVLTGRIVDTSGRPLAHARLKAVAVPTPDLFPLCLDPAVGTASTDAAGTFALHGLRAGRKYRVVVSTDELSTANGERTVTAGSRPIDIALDPAVPVTLAISGRLRLREDPRLAGQRSAEVAAAFAALDKRLIELSLTREPDLVEGVWAGSGYIGSTIFMDWLDPDTGTWLPVFSPRHVKVKDATHVDLLFDQVPVGTIRIQTWGSEFEIADEVFGPMIVKAGVPAVIPVHVTPRR